MSTLFAKIKTSSETELQYFLEVITMAHQIYTMDRPKFIVPSKKGRIHSCILMVNLNLLSQIDF